MATKDIKVGNFYHVLVKVLGIDPTRGEITTETVNEFGTSLNMEPTYFARDEKEAFFPIILENGRKNSEPAPKYDPCRRFRKGDKVRLIEWNGRKPFDTHHSLKPNPGEVHIVLDDEYDRNEVYIGMSAADEEQSVVHACNLELITPVEELEPYTVDECGFDPTLYVRKNGKVYMAIPYNEGTSLFQTREEALATAEAECARLNAEYRKEQR